LTIRKWFYWFWTTLLWGMGAGLVTGLVLQFSDDEFATIGLPGTGYNMLTMLLGGATISVLCQMGFFAYLVLRVVAMSLVRRKKIWDWLQLFFVFAALYELVSLRYLFFGEGLPLIRFFALPAVILAVSVAVAYWKTKLTNVNAFIPTLFFMVVGTVVEAVPAFKINTVPSIVFMLIPLIVCNAWQIMILHKLVDET